MHFSFRIDKVDVSQYVNIFSNPSIYKCSSKTSAFNKYGFVAYILSGCTTSVESHL